MDGRGWNGTTEQADPRSIKRKATDSTDYADCLLPSQRGLRPQPDQESRKRGKQEGLSRSQDAFDLKRIYARISRRLRLLRAHGVIRKISKTHRDRPTEHGQLLTASQFAACEASVKGLLAKAS